MRRRFLAAFVVGLLWCGGGACVIAQPTDDIPTLPASRPVIIRSRVEPPVSGVLTFWPESYTLYVQLADPTITLQTIAFTDYNPLTGGTLLGTVPQYDPLNGAAPADRVRTVTLNVPVSSSLDRCHVIEIIVSPQFAFSDSRSAHNPPDPPGSDSITWYYAPGGDLTGCPTLDAGIDATVIQDGSDSEAN